MFLSDIEKNPEKLALLPAVFIALLKINKNQPWYRNDKDKFNSFNILNIFLVLRT